MFAACDFLNVPDNGPVIKGDQVAAVKLNPQQQNSMDKIFSLSNPVMKARVETLKNDKNSKDVYLIGSQSELLALCSDVLTPPEIDFKHHSRDLWIGGTTYLTGRVSKSRTLSTE